MKIWQTFILAACLASAGVSTSFGATRDVQRLKARLRKSSFVSSEYKNRLANEVAVFRISAQGLPNKDPFGGPPDPYVVVSYRNSSSGEYKTIGRTSKISDTVNPVWDDFIVFHGFLRGAQQVLRLEVKDHDPAIWDDKIGNAFINIDNCLWESQSKITETTSCQAQIGETDGVLYFNLL